MAYASDRDTRAPGKTNRDKLNAFFNSSGNLNAGSLDGLAAAAHSNSARGTRNDLTKTDNNNLRDASLNLESMSLTSDGRPCRACTDFRSYTAQTTGFSYTSEDDEYSSRSARRPTKSTTVAHHARGKNDAENSSRTAAASPAALPGSSVLSNTDTSQHDNCPLDSRELGQRTWGFLHTMAAYYPENPTAEQRRDMTTFYRVFSQFYPCEHCAADLRRDLEDKPVQAGSRNQLTQWLCRMHNRVNRKLGKDEFDCLRVDERWRDGWKDSSCGYYYGDANSKDFTSK